jgi:hypothetical protein
VNPYSGTFYVRQYAFGGPWVIKQYPVGGPWSTATTYDQGIQQVTVGTDWWTGPMNGAGSQGAYVVYNAGETGGQLAMWDPLTNNWFADLRGFGGENTYNTFLSYSEVHNVAVFGGGNAHSRAVWRLNSDATVTTLPNAPVGVGIRKANVVSDPVSGNFLVLGSDRFYEFDPRGSGSWTQLSGSSVPPSGVGDPSDPDGDGSYDGMISAPIPDYGVVMYVSCRPANCKVHLYKHGSSNSGDDQPPSPPSGLTAVAVSATQVNLDWTASTDNVGVAEYRVRRNGIEIGTTVSVSYVDNTAAPSTTYTYTVVARDAAGNVSAPSAAAQVTTPDLPIPLPPGTVEVSESGNDRRASSQVS